MMTRPPPPAGFLRIRVVAMAAPGRGTRPRGRPCRRSMSRPVDPPACVDRGWAGGLGQDGGVPAAIAPRRAMLRAKLLLCSSSSPLAFLAYPLTPHRPIRPAPQPHRTGPPAASPLERRASAAQRRHAGAFDKKRGLHDPLHLPPADHLGYVSSHVHPESLASAPLARGPCDVGCGWRDPINASAGRCRHTVTEFIRCMPRRSTPWLDAGPSYHG